MSIRKKIYFCLASYYLLYDFYKLIRPLLKKPYATIILGPGIFIGPELISELNKQLNIFFIHNLESTKATCKGVKISSNTVYLYGRASKSNEYDYKLNLCGWEDTFSASFKSIINLITLPQIYYIIPQKNHLHFELFSNFSQKILSDITLLPQESTIITSSSVNKASVYGILDEIIITSSIFNYNDDPYLKFIYYIFINPDDSGFAVNLGHSTRYFVTNINELQQFSDNHIKEWQDIQVRNFLIFLKNISKSYNYNNFESDTNFTTWYNNVQEQALCRYKELLLFNYIAQGSDKNVKSLIKENVNPNASLINHINTIFAATFYKNIDLLEYFINSGVDINCSNKDGVTPIMIATIKESKESIILLYGSGADLNALNKYNETALFTALLNKKFEIAKLLIEFGADVNIANIDRETPLLLTSRYNELDIFKLILAQAPHFSHFYDYEHNKAIYDIINDYNVDPLKYILMYNKNTNLTLSALNTLLYNINDFNIYDNDIYKFLNCIGNLDNTTLYDDGFYYICS